MFASTPSSRISTFFLAGLSLSIGWGIRGNFGHEYAAMFAGCLAAIVVCLLSGRQDWRERVAYFAFFGALGWGFGGSMSYMQVIAYTHSGHWPSQIWGFAGLFLIGFLWAGMGGAGTAYPAVVDRERMTAIFYPLMFVLVFFVIILFLEDPLNRFLQWRIQSAGAFDGTWHRHESPLYWYDSDWIKAATALLAVCIYDLCNRHSWNTIFLPFLAWGGAAGGHYLERSMHRLPMGDQNLAERIADILTRPTGVPGGETVLLKANGQSGLIAMPDNMLTNWPEFIMDMPINLGGFDYYLSDVLHKWFLHFWPNLQQYHVVVRDLWVGPGLLVGSILGIALYFIIFGKFRNGASLFVYMALGWLLFFLIVPVFGGIAVYHIPVLYEALGGLGMTPPRSEDWAGITGVFIGTTVWLLRNKLTPVSYASVVCGFVGGIGFSGIQLLKLFTTWFGSGYRLVPVEQEAMRNAAIADIERLRGAVGTAAQQAMPAEWAHYQEANWHSFLEQSYGFVNGIAVALAIALLARRIRPLNDYVPTRRWTAAFAAFFVIIGLTYVNLSKNAPEWTSQLKWFQPVLTEAGTPLLDDSGNAVMEPVRWGVPPFPEWIQLTPAGWFNVMYAAMALAFLYVARRHLRRPVGIVPDDPVGRGQLLYLILLWAMCIGNLERALPAFSEGRIMTEGVIWLNCVLATALILTLPRAGQIPDVAETPSFGPRLLNAAVVTVVGAVFVVGLEFGATRLLYGDNWSGHSGWHMRFGPKADWRIRPNLKNQEHR